MINFCSLSSGSSGNAIFLEYNGTSVLIDCGLSCKRICDLLIQIGKRPEDISGMLVTHEHSDHIKGISVLTRKYHIPVYSAKNTFENMPETSAIAKDLQHFISSGNEFSLGNIGVLPFSIPHDASMPLGYTFQLGDTKVSVATDMGKIDSDVALHLKGSDLILLESNYDTQMLIDGPYPYFLKRRILSEHGHLSNEQAAKLALSLARTGTKNFLFGHLSDTNNTPDIVLNTMISSFEQEGFYNGKNIDIAVANRYSPSKLYTL